MSLGAGPGGVPPEVSGSIASGGGVIRAPPANLSANGALAQPPHTALPTPLDPTPAIMPSSTSGRVTSMVARWATKARAFSATPASAAPASVGILAMETYVSSRYVCQEALEKFDGVSAGKYTVGASGIHSGGVRLPLADTQLDRPTRACGASGWRPPRARARRGLPPRACARTAMAL